MALKYIPLIFAILAWASPVQSQRGKTASYRIEMTATPRAVNEGEDFKLEVKLTSVKSRRRGYTRRNFYTAFNPPSLKDFELIDQAESTQSQMGIYNGTYYHEMSVVITYQLRAKKTGVYTLTPATMKADGKTWRSNTLKINVKPPKSLPPAIKDGTEPEAANAGDDFIQVTFDKKNVVVGEGVVISWYIYTYKPISEAPRSDIPDAPGFISKSLFSHHHQFDVSKRANVSGEQYYRVLAFKRMYWPQKAGKLVIGKRSVSYVTATDFFSPRKSVTRMASAVELTVSDLPAAKKPADFSDDNVGEFTIDMSLVSTSLKTNEAIDVTVTIEGKGLLSSIKGPVMPKLDWARLDPNGAPQVTEKLIRESYFKGTWKGSYILIPTKTGNHTFPPVKFSYFDTKKKKYVTLTTKKAVFNIAQGTATAPPVAVNPDTPGINGTSAKENTLAPQIKPLKVRTITTSSTRAVFFSGVTFTIVLIIPFFAWAGIGITLLVRRKLTSDENFVKRRATARKIRQFVKSAHLHMKSGDSQGFYSELSKLLLETLSVRLGTRANGLTMDELHSRMKSSGLDDSTIKDTVEMLESLDFARYAPNKGMTQLQFESALADVKKLCNRID